MPELDELPGLLDQLIDAVMTLIELYVDGIADAYVLRQTIMDLLLILVQNIGNSED